MIGMGTPSIHNKIPRPISISYVVCELDGA